MSHSLLKSDEVSRLLPDLNGPINSFTTARCAGDMTACSAAVVVDLGIMAQYGLLHDMPSDIKNAIPDGDLNTIQRLAAQLDDYEFVVHPVDIA